MSRIFRKALVPQVRRVIAASRRNFCAAAAPFDVFASGTDVPTDTSGDSKKRTPEIAELADKILNLSLLQASELCEICQEKLAGPGGIMPMGMPMMGMMGNEIIFCSENKTLRAFRFVNLDISPTRP